MQTDALIRSLAADLTVKWPLSRAFAVTILAGAAVAALLFALALGLRPDLLQAAATVRFAFKVVVTLCLAVVALGLVWRMAHPGASLDAWVRALSLPPALVIVACVCELFATPASAWQARLIGQNALLCLAAIPLLSMGPLACLIAWLRSGFVTRPGLTGAVAGLAASGIGATLYASHCPDDSPLFVATWYAIGAGVVTAVGCLAGRKLLR